MTVGCIYRIGLISIGKIKGGSGLEQFADQLVTYGALGIVCAYFMVKDITINREITAALKEFTISLKTFVDVCTIKNGVDAK